MLLMPEQNKSHVTIEEKQQVLCDVCSILCCYWCAPLMMFDFFSQRTQCLGSVVPLAMIIRGDGCLLTTGTLRCQRSPRHSLRLGSKPGRLCSDEMDLIYHKKKTQLSSPTLNSVKNKRNSLLLKIDFIFTTKNIFISAISR